MAIKRPDWKKIREKLKTIYRFQIVDEKSYDVKLVLELNRINVIVATGLLLLFFTIINFFLIAFTPLKQYIPGYGSSSGKREVIQMSMKAEELEDKVNAQNKFVVNLQNILNDKIVIDQEKVTVKKSKTDTGILSMKTTDESQFVKNVEKGLQNAELMENVQDTKTSIFNSLSLQKPVNGIIITPFSLKNNSVSFAASANEEVKAILSGNVISEGNSPESGKFVIVQAENQIVYVLKNNSNILKKSGNFVTVGETIAIAGKDGNSNNYISRLELWYKGQPIDASKFIK